MIYFIYNLALFNYYNRTVYSRRHPHLTISTNSRKKSYHDYD